MSYYAIQHIPTGGFLPTRDGMNTRGGYTNDDPTLAFPPRLFHDEGAAKRALTWWLKGETWVSRWEYEEDWGHRDRPERKREDMRIIKITLTWEDTQNAYSDI